MSDNTQGVLVLLAIIVLLWWAVGPPDPCRGLDIEICWEQDQAMRWDRVGKGNP